MGVQESLNQVIAELANRRIQLKLSGDPNLASALDGALVGTTVLQDDVVPMVVWRKNRAGSNGWDLEIITPSLTPYVVYVDCNTTSPAPDGSIINPYPTIQDALDAVGSATTLDDFYKVRFVRVAPGFYDESPVVPPARQAFLLLEGAVTINGYVTITVDHNLYPIGYAGYTRIGICNSEVVSLGSSLSVFPDLLGIQYNVINPVTSGLLLFVFAVDVWEMIDVSVNPGTLVNRSVIQITRSGVYGKDIGGGVWKAVYAPYSMIATTEALLTSETDVNGYDNFYLSNIYDLRLRSTFMWPTLHVNNGVYGITGSDIQGIVTTPVSTTKCLPCDRYSMRMFDLYSRYGWVTIDLSHVYEYHDMWSNEQTVNVGTPAVIDLFPIGSGRSCEWEVDIYRGSPATQIRRSRIGAAWTSAGIINTQGEVKLGDVGDTSSITLTVDISGGTTVRLIATTTVTSTWKVRVLRHITHAHNYGGL